ncbi:hemin importer ATP-binding subunit [Vibrio phage vB_VmeM-32]|nr:hemin importer ATP-binding subunit [Vibrio phage vB_VmeM-32]
MRIYRESKIHNDTYTQHVYDNFDIQTKDKIVFEIEFPKSRIKSDWNIGLVLGGSGTGKSTILREFGEEIPIEFDDSKTLISNFSHLTEKEASEILSLSGLNSIPTWLKPFSVLSGGEKYRATMAMILSKCKENDTVVIDEFTSTVDRDVAKSMSYSVQKLIKKKNLRVVFAACHYDIFEWLMPDWSFNTLTGVLENHEYLRRKRPEIELQVHRATYHTWKIFKQHHYLTHSLNKSAKIFVYTWNGKPVGLVAALQQPQAGDKRYAMSLSRTVILPDYQGLGLGPKISEYTAGMLMNISGGYVYARTIHPTLGNYRSNSPNWTPTSTNGKMTAEDKMSSNRLRRPAYSHRYVGPIVENCENLLHPIEYYSVKSDNCITYQHIKDILDI